MALREFKPERWLSFKFNKAMANASLLEYLQHFRHLALVVQKGELLNFGEYYTFVENVENFGFTNLEKLEAKPNVVPLPPELFSEIDEMIRPLPKKTAWEIVEEWDVRRAAAVAASL